MLQRFFVIHNRSPDIYIYAISYLPHIIRKSAGVANRASENEPTTATAIHKIKNNQLSIKGKCFLILDKIHRCLSYVF